MCSFAIPPAVLPAAVAEVDSGGDKVDAVQVDAAVKAVADPVAVAGREEVPDNRLPRSSDGLGERNLATDEHG